MGPLYLPETECSQAEKFATRLKDEISRHSQEGGDKSVPYTVSIGVAGYPNHGDNVENILKKADDALYAAKNQGRNCVITAI
ncbi:MAG: GGDEF domain-containing protein [Desulfobacterium sp.]|nr:GGDEF domain-containing protein [Desulfobacterium sp.]